MTLGQPGDYEDILPFQKALFFTIADEKNRLETSMVGVLILSDLIYQRADLMYNECLKYLSIFS